MYAQINFSQRLGNGPYTLAEAGCLVTAFCNLLNRFGEPIDPGSLNAYFNDNGSYSHDPSEPEGTTDNLGWGSVSAYDGQVVAVGIGGAGWPDSNDAIVKFIYRSPRTGAIVTHFTLVADAESRVIVDSYDGRTKISPYGDPVAWAKYERHQPQIVTPPPPAEEPNYTIENIPERTEDLKVDTKLWDLNQRSWPGLVNNPIKDAPAGTEFKTSAIAHHILGGSYYMPDVTVPQGYNVVDCSDAPQPPPPPPAVYTENTVNDIKYEAYPEPKQMYISKIGGADKWDFGSAKTYADFKSTGKVDFSTAVNIVGVAHHPIGADYYMIAEDFGDFVHSGGVKNPRGFNWSDLSTSKPGLGFPLPISNGTAAGNVSSTTPDNIVVTVNPPTPPVAPPTTTITLPDWRTTYRPFIDKVGTRTPVKYVALKNYIVTDIEGKGKDIPLHQYDYVVLGGTFTKDGVVYGRPQVAATKFMWYGIPMDNQTIASYKDLFEAKTSTATRQALHTLKAGDYLVLGIEEISKIAAKIEKAWAMLPFKNKNKQKK